MEDHTEAIEEKERRLMNEILEVIKSELPFDFSEYKEPTILKRIRRRATALNITDLSEYVTVLRGNPEEVKILAKDFMIRVTSFFRDQESYKELEEKVIPAIFSNVTDGMIKVWVAGCATGEEAYSMAILFSEQKGANNCEIKIFATDIDKAALDIASRGKYSKQIERDVSPERLQKYFIKEGDSYKVKGEIRKMLIFSQHDLAKNPPYCNVDLISCRNVLIYLNSIAQRRVFSMLHFGLKINGFLFLGMSENLPAKSNLFTEISNKSRIYRNTSAKRTVAVDSFTTPVLAHNPLQPLTQRRIDSAHYSDEFSAELLKILCEQTDSAGICMDMDQFVLQYFGDITRYLKGKLFTLRLIDALPEQSREVFKAAVHKAIVTQKKVVLNKFMVSDQVSASVNIIAHVAKSGKMIIIVLFNSKNGKNNNDGHIFTVEKDVKEYVNELEQEVNTLKWQLARSQDEVNASRENLQSFNEELLSANEEMQSTNEEWQSVNEELQTINSQYQLRIKELVELNDDLNNYFRSNVNAQLFVDKDLLLKKFSPSATKHINLRAIDIGRPLNEITTNIKITSLVDDLKAVIVSGDLIMREVSAENDTWYQLLIMPYIRQPNNTRDGAIITFYDITKLKKVERNLDAKNLILKRINTELDDFVYALSNDLTAWLNNLEQLIRSLKNNEQTGAAGTPHVNELIQSTFESLRTTIRILADIGKIESEMLKEPEVVSFESLVNDVKEDLRNVLSSVGCQVVSAFSEDKIRFSKNNLRLILHNLIDTAIQHSNGVKNPKVYINTYRVPGFIVIMAKDNGPEVVDDELKSILTGHTRLPETEQRLGLYLVKKVTYLAGGRIEIESLPGEGTVFKVYLPYDANVL